MMGSSLRGAVWVVIYLLFILAPLFALLSGSMPPARDFWTEFAVAIGYSGLAMMGLQFGLTARFRYVTAPWGEDVIYHFHRQISQIAVGLVVAHALIMSIRYPEMFAMPGSLADVPLGAVFAFVSIFALIALVVTAIWRVKLKIGYETWHAAHIVLAVVAVSAGMIHMAGMGLLPVRPMEADAVDRPHPFLDRAVGLRARDQASFHASPALPRCGSAQGTRRHDNVGDAA